MTANLREILTTCWVGDLLLGLPATDVREVIQHPPITAIPLAPPVLRGVFNVRGELVTVMDLRRRLGLPEADTAAATHMLIPTREGTVSLLVDRQGDLIEVDPATFETPPSGLADHARECVLGAYKLSDRLLIVLDTQRTLHLNDADELGGSDPQQKREATT